MTQNQIEDYCRQRLGVAELLRVSDHLGDCHACRLQVECGMNGDAAFFALRAEVFGESAAISSRSHLTAEQTVEYVDSNLSGEELQMISDHLTHCEQCALAVDDLQAFKNQIAPSLDHEYHPAIVSSQREGRWHRTIASLLPLFWRSQGLAFGSALSFGSALTFGAALTVLLLAVTGWLILRTPQNMEPNQKIADSPAPPSQPAPVPVVAELNDGESRLTLDREGKLSGAGDLPLDYQNMLREALATRRVERSSQLLGLNRTPSSLMSTDKHQSEFSVTEPVGKVLMSDHPTFRWSPMEGASLYVVEVYDSNFNLVAASPELTKNSWVGPTLARGKIYSWQVKATKAGEEFTSPRPPAPQARFRVLDRAKANELEKARRAYQSSHLTLGLLYAEAGLLKEAEQELRALQKANPDSEIARSLLQKVQALRR